MTPREANHDSHSPPPVVLLEATSWLCRLSDTILNRCDPSPHKCGYPLLVFQCGTGFARTSRATHCASARQVAPKAQRRAQRSFSFEISSSVALGEYPCTAPYPAGRQRHVNLTDTLRGRRGESLKHNEFNGQTRTNLSVRVIQRSAFAISRSWLSPTKQKPTSHSRLGTTLARAGAGWLTTPSRRA
jgi:hypothetical protein